MRNTESSQPPSPPPSGAQEASLYRSGAVAHMLRMPVATLRVWERRYGVTRAALSPGGQRLYSADDVRRLALLKQLTDSGHAIGSLARLTMSQLQRVALTHAHARAATRKGERPGGAGAPTRRPWRLVVIGAALATRLQRPSLLRRLGRPVELLGPFADLAQAATGTRGSDVDAVLMYEPHLQQGWLSSVDAAAPAFAGVPKAVLYGFAADAVCDALATAGTALLREPQPDAVVAQWLHGLSMATAAAQPLDRPALPAEAVPPRQWDDAALAAFAGRSSTVACECPRHVAELLAQLSHFEAYSAECGYRNAADAALHGYLRQVAAASRAEFEAALAHVALHEGLVLPPSLPRSLRPSPRQADATAAPKARRPKALASARPRHRP